MNLSLKRNIKNIFEKYKVSPSKRLGQNFLITDGVVQKIIKETEIAKDDIILEVGPGTGTITIELAKKAKKVIAIEKDPKMVEILKETMKDFNNVEIVEGDILKIKNLKLKNKNYKIVANLPFYLTSPVIYQFLEAKEIAKKIILIIQKEVAQRICVKSSKMNLLAISVQFYSQPKILGYISKGSFWPQPKVDSAILQIEPMPIALKKEDVSLFFKIIRFGFSQPRKQLINNLSKGLKVDKIRTEQWLIKNNIQPAQRAETLAIKEWLKLTKTFKKI